MTKSDKKYLPNDSTDAGVHAVEHDLLDPKNWIGAESLAAILGMNVQSIYNLLSTGGDLPPVYKKSRLVRFFRPEVEAWLIRGRRVPFGMQVDAGRRNHS